MAQILLKNFAARAKAVLGRSRIFDLRALEVGQIDGCVVLRGSVDSFYHKQLAQELHFTGDTNDSAAMNVWLHKQVMTKLAESGGKVPDSLKA